MVGDAGEGNALVFADRPRGERDLQLAKATVSASSSKVW
jgi:hypothetical protein